MSLDFIEATLNETVQLNSCLFDHLSLLCYFEIKKDTVNNVSGSALP